MRLPTELTSLAGIALALLLLAPNTAVRAQTPAIDELKGKIFDAHMAQQTFADGLKHCTELDGKSVYQQLHKRILNLEEYLRSLDSLVKAQVFNPEKKRPWTVEDAKERWEEVKKEAEEDKARCELVSSLPQLESQLREMQKNAPAPAQTTDKKN